MQEVVAPLKTIIAAWFLARAQIDLISTDDDAKADRPYKFIGNFIDLYSKYEVLFWLKDKSAEIVGKK